MALKRFEDLGEKAHREVCKRVATLLFTVDGGKDGLPCKGESCN